MKFLLNIVLVGSVGLCVSCGSNRGASANAANSQGDRGVRSPVEVAKVVSKKLAITVRMPGELQPYEGVAVYPKVTAFVDSIRVDRGSVVKAGEPMAQLAAPEIAAQRAEAQSKLQGAEAQRGEAEAKLASDESTYQRLKAASTTPGVVAGNDLEVAQRAVEADRARVESVREGAQAARSALKSVSEIEGYLQVRAPFDGVGDGEKRSPGHLWASQRSGVGVPSCGWKRLPVCAAGSGARKVCGRCDGRSHRPNSVSRLFRSKPSLEKSRGLLIPSTLKHEPCPSSWMSRTVMGI